MSLDQIKAARDAGFGDTSINAILRDLIEVFGVGRVQEALTDLSQEDKREIPLCEAKQGQEVEYAGEVWIVGVSSPFRYGHIQVKRKVDGRRFSLPLDTGVYSI